jgi:chromate transporter
MNMLFNLFTLFLKIGLFSFGGGYVMLPLIFQGVTKIGAMSEREFSNLVALSQVTPGPIAVNAATYMGYKLAGITGALAATVGVVIPSFILVITVSHFINKFEESNRINGILSGIRPATVGLLGSAVVFLSETSIFNDGIFTTLALSNPMVYINLIPVGIFVLALFAYGKLKINPILLTLLSGGLGAILIR